MRRIDQHLGENPFFIDSVACQSAAQIIRAFRGDNFVSPWSALPHSIQLLFKISFIAICHQINWDFLQSRLAENILADSGKEILQKIRNVDSNEMQKWLEGYDKPDRIRAKERSAILREIGDSIFAELGGEPMAMFVASENKIGGTTGFLRQLDRFRAFSEDPLRKKSNVLLQELTRERILQFDDIESIRPAIDYHIMRVYLRSGRVIPKAREIKEQLKKVTVPRERLVKLLREKVGEALDLTAFYAGLPVSEVNYIEWQIGRSICKVDQPACSTNLQDPELDEAVAKLFDGPCPYTNFCEAYSNIEWRQLREPELKRSFY